MVPSPRRPGRPAALLALCLALGCGGGAEGGGEADPVGVALAFVNVPSASAASRVPLAVQPVLQVVDADGAPVAAAGITITATLTAGSGGLAGATTAVTGADGHAAFTSLQVQGSVGGKTLTFSAPGLTSVGHGLTLTPGAAAALARQAGQGQIALVNSAVAIPLAAKVTDADGNAVAGVTVTFAVTGGSGAVTGAAPVSGVDGVATLGSWTLGGAAGTNTVQATSPGIVAALDYTALATVPLPSAPSYNTLAAGYSHSCAVAADGDTYCWGLVPPAADPMPMEPSNATTRPVKVSGGVAFVTLEAGERFTCGLTAGGAAYCWGTELGGDLGDGGANSDQAAPVAVSGGYSFTSLTVGAASACGIANTGTTYCWGYNLKGGLGDGSTTDRYAPTAVSGGPVFTKVVMGMAHTCGLTDTGAAWCWGDNNAAQLGDSTTTQRLAPVAVIGGLSFSDLALGQGNSCGITTAGAAYCWGGNGGGLLGVDTSVTTVRIPRAVGGGHTFTRIWTYDQSFCALTSAGAAWCWGANNEGMLGDGSQTFRTSPVAVSGGLTFTTLSVGRSHTCGTTSGGALRCWGDNALGQLGTADTLLRTVPTVVSPPAPVVASVVVIPSTLSVPVGQSQALTAVALTAEGAEIPGQSFAWSSSNTGAATVNGTGLVTALGAGTASIVVSSGGKADTATVTVTAPPPGPVATVTVTPATASVAVGATTPLTAVVKDANGIVITTSPVTWSSTVPANATVSGAGVVTGVAVGNALVIASAGGKSDTAAITVTAPGNAGWTVASITAANNHACAVTSAGKGYCWGWGIDGQLGTGDADLGAWVLGPHEVAGGYTWKEIRASTAGRHTCGVTTAGQGYCWGAPSGIFGVGKTTQAYSSPQLVPGGKTWKTLRPSTNQVCGIATDDLTYCWGVSNLNGGIGNTTGFDTVRVLSPAAVLGGHLFTALDVGENRSCGLKADGSLWCWGATEYLDDPSAFTYYQPTKLDTAIQWAQLSVGVNFVCGASTAGTPYCFGINTYLGNGDSTAGATWPPVSPTVAGNVSEVVAGGNVGCLRTTGGTGYCWGEGAMGTATGGPAQLTRSPRQLLGGLSFTRLVAGGNAFACGIATDTFLYCWGFSPQGALGTGKSEPAASAPVKVQTPP